MSSSIKVDLDFQDFSPSGGDSKIKESKPGTSSLIRIPELGPERDQKSQGTSKVFNFLQDITNPRSTGSNFGFSPETLQQLAWAANIQRSRHQRNSISASGSWGLGYFVQYFDVTTQDVLQRIIWSFIPIRKVYIDLDDNDLILPLNRNLMENDLTAGQSDPTNKKRKYSYIERFIQSRPDLYGPLWIGITLIFAIGMFSNIVSFIDYRSKLSNYYVQNYANSANNSLPSKQYVDMNFVESNWHYSMNELNLATSVVTWHVIVLPIFIWFLFWFRGCNKNYSLTETICAYGYSLSIFVPMSALLIVQATLYRWLIMLLMSALSGFVLLLSFLPVVHSDPNTSSSNLMLILLVVSQLATAYIIHRIMSI